MPGCMALGIGYHEFWSMNPRGINTFIKAYDERMKLRDAEMWHMGKYVSLAVADSIAATFGGDDFKPIYPERPMMDDSLSEEELEQKRIEREIQKAIAAEEAWIAYYTLHGTPQ